MSFNSITFAVFLVAVFLIYWSVPPKHRWILLLVSSYYFYMSWNTIYIFLIFFTTVISYLCGRLLAGTQSKNKKKAILFCSASVSLGILFLFKYFNFFADIFFMGARLFSLPVHPVTLSLLLPVGISFYTFQTLSYVIDVYYGKAEAEKHFGKYAVFIAFFPQLVAGPIERTENLLPQIKEEHVFAMKKLRRKENAPPHKDPFDRMLICQAIVEDMTFVTHDSLILYYEEPCILAV